MAWAYYNEINPYAAAWLRNLMAAGHIAGGEVDERSIADVRADDLGGFDQCHFFAGIGVWSHALRLAGWPDDRAVWTGSCPCQPFSVAGAQQGVEDERHLWPAWFRLIGPRRPNVVFGEQVASQGGLAWLDLVHADMEGAGYAIRSADLCAAGFGAPHIRQRLYFVADTDEGRSGRDSRAVSGAQGEAGRGVRRLVDGTEPGGATRELAYADGGNAGTEGLQRSGQHRLEPQDRSAGGPPLGDAAGRGLGELWEAPRPRSSGHADGAEQPGFWECADWLPCIDGKARPVEPGTFPLAHGLAGRVGRLRAYGNAIVAPVAAEFIRAYVESSAP